MRMAYLLGVNSGLTTIQIRHCYRSLFHAFPVIRTPIVRRRQQLLRCAIMLRRGATNTLINYPSAVSQHKLLYHITDCTF